MTNEIEELEQEARLMRARNERLQEEVEALSREVAYWRDMHGSLLKTFTDHAALLAKPPVMLAVPESYEAGRAMAFNEAAYTIGIDTLDGAHMVVVTRTLPGQDPAVVAMSMLPEDDWK